MGLFYRQATLVGDASSLPSAAANRQAPRTATMSVAELADYEGRVEYFGDGLSPTAGKA